MNDPVPMAMGTHHLRSMVLDVAIPGEELSWGEFYCGFGTAV
jgi:hypothetical protein